MNDHPRVIKLSPTDSRVLASALLAAEMRPTAEAQRRAHRLRTLNELDREAAERYDAKAEDFRNKGQRVSRAAEYKARIERLDRCALAFAVGIVLGCVVSFAVWIAGLVF